MQKKQELGQIGKINSKQYWECKYCTFQNFGLLNQCEMCSKPKQIQHKPENQIKKQKKQDESLKGFVCTSCTYVNTKFGPYCQMCNTKLIQGFSDEQQFQQHYDEGLRLVVCSCGAQNDQAVRYCENCGKKIYIKKRTQKRKPIKRPRLTYNQCIYCYRSFRGGQIMLHQQRCLAKKDQEVDQSKIIYPEECNFCNQKIGMEGFKDHNQKCQAKIKFYIDNKSFDRLTNLQLETITYMHKKYQSRHFAARVPLLEKMKRLGFTAKDLDNLHHYIVFYAPIIIHVHVNTHMQFFVKDTNYKNQFQTQKSSGSLSKSARTTWEDRMFDRKHHNAKDFERVKYGTINFTNDPKGVRACAGYGQSYFLLKQHVRDRCTVTDMDSSSSVATIGTFRFCFHVLNKLSDVELKAAVDGSKAKEVASLGVIGTYKQIQIHGPVEFKKDIQRLYINKAQTQTFPDSMRQCKQFCQTNNLQYQIFEYEKIAPPSTHAFSAFGGFGVGVHHLYPPALVPPSPPGFLLSRPSVWKGEDYI